MKSDVIVVSSESGQIDTALRQVEKVAEYKGLSAQGTLHLRLLTEEMMGLVRSITGQTKGEFWIEDHDGLYEIHLKANTLMDDQQRSQLISASSSGVNEATRGLMGKIRAFFEPSSSMPLFSSALMMGSAAQMHHSLEWSMEDYRDQVRQYRDQKREGAQEAWDELEKSVVAHVADDVKVSIQGRTVDMTIFKRLA